MKCVYLCLLITMCYSIPIDKKKTLKAPNNFISTAVIKEPSSLVISWPPVDAVDPKDPILGYKVKIIQLEKTKRTINKFDPETKQTTTVEVDEYPELNGSVTPQGNFTELIAEPSDLPLVTFFEPQVEVPYQFTIRAFTKNQDGPASSPIRITINDDKAKKAKAGKKN